MTLGEHLYKARKQNHLSQEELAEKLSVSRQTISKWELGETIPDLSQAKKLAQIYQIRLDELVEMDSTLVQIKTTLQNTDETTVDAVNWTNVWSKKYPVLETYQKEASIQKYTRAVRSLLDQLKEEYSWSELDAMLVLKDILYQEWKQNKK